MSPALFCDAGGKLCYLLDIGSLKKTFLFSQKNYGKFEKELEEKAFLIQTLQKEKDEIEIEFQVRIF